MSLINTLCATSTVSDVVGKLESVEKVLRPCVLVNLDIYIYIYMVGGLPSSFTTNVYMYQTYSAPVA